MKNTRKKRILFLSWKDINHPGAGGAELLTDTLATHMAQHYEVEYFTSSYPGALPVEQVHGYTIIRKGNIYTTYLHAFLWWHWNRMYHKKYSCIIDQVHGIPFFSLLYIFHPPINTLVMEIAGELWQKNYPNSIGIVGKILERIWLALYRSSVITTISESTKNELLARHIPARHIYMIPMFSPMQCNAIPIKATSPTLLMVGRIAPVKRIEDAIEAYKIAHKSIPSLQFVIIGRTESMYAKYTSYLLQKISDNAGITFLENATESEKNIWLQRAHLLIVTSIKEGYGLVTLEAAACGTPTISYDIPGIRDAVLHQKTGILAQKKEPLEISRLICEILGDTARYNSMQKLTFEYTKAHTKERTGVAFEKIVTHFCLP